MICRWEEDVCFVRVEGGGVIRMWEKGYDSYVGEGGYDSYVGEGDTVGRWEEEI